MSRTRKRAINQPKMENSIVKQVIEEKKVELSIFPKMERLDVEFQIRKDKLMSFLKSTDFNLSDCEKILGMAYDCRNTARKIFVVENRLIIA